MKTIKTGVIGCGLIAQMEWLPYLHELEEYEVVAVQEEGLQNIVQNNIRRHMFLMTGGN